MDIERTFCPVCQRDVLVATTTASLHSGGHASIPDGPRRICLDFGDACDPLPAGGQSARRGGAICPVFHTPAVVMGVRKARSGLAGEPLRTMDVYCEGCEEERRQERVGPVYAFCRVCGSTNPIESRKGRAR